MTEIPPARPNRRRRIAVRLVWIAWGIGIAVTALGFTAAWIPVFDLINDARPLGALAAALLFVIAVGLREQGLVRPTASLALLQIGLLLLPWARAADRASAAPPSLRLVTFDLGPGEDNFDRIADFITAAQADAVLLQGVSCAAVDRLIPKLKPIFPNALVPADGCDGQALMAKRAWLAGGQVTTRSRRPLLVWARFQWDRHTFVLTGVHLSGPLSPNEQAADIGRLQAHLATQGPAHIVAGSFNVTPFAWAFAQLQNSGLGQHATYLGNFVASWPVRWNVPMLLPDNVLSSDGIASVRLSTGPALGSAHLPLIADIAFVK